MGLNNSRRTRLQNAIAAWRQKIADERAAAEAAAASAREQAAEDDAVTKTSGYADTTESLNTSIASTKTSLDAKITQMNSLVTAINSATDSTTAAASRDSLISLQSDITTLMQNIIDYKSQIESVFESVKKNRRSYTATVTHYNRANTAYTSALTSYNSVSGSKASVDAAIAAANSKVAELKAAEEASAVASSSLSKTGGTVSGDVTVAGNLITAGNLYLDSNGNQFYIDSNTGRDNFYWRRNGVNAFHMEHASTGDLYLYSDNSGNFVFNGNNTGNLQIANGALKLGNTTESAASVGAGGIKYDPAQGLLASNGSAWNPIYRERDGSANKPLHYLSDVQGLYNSGDATLYVNLGGLAETIQYTVNFDAAYPRFKATNATSGDVFDTAGTAGGCSQGTGSAWDWYSAVTYCMKGGARPCSLAEIENSEIKGTGCSHDSRAIWSWTHDDAGNYYVRQGDTTGAGAGGGWYAADFTGTPSPFDLNEFGIRCCGTGSTGGAYWEDDSV